MNNKKTITIEVTPQQLNEMIYADRLYKWFYDNNTIYNLTLKESEEIDNMEVSKYLTRDKDFEICLKYLRYQVASLDDIYEVFQMHNDLPFKYLELKFGPVEKGAEHIANLYQWGINNLQLDEWPIQLTYTVLQSVKAKENKFTCEYTEEELEMQLFMDMR